MRRPLRALSPFLGVLALFGVVAGACGDDSPASARSESVTGDLTVLAAASLTDAFKEIGSAFERAHTGTKVTFSFAASSALVTQITQGAPADVFASADTANMKKLTDAGGASGNPVTFATNKLQIIVGKNNPKNINGVTDFTRPGVVYVASAPEVPIGAYAKQVLDKAGVTVTPKSLEADVKAVVNKVTLGEADAGIVYATDVKAAGAKATGVVIPEDINVVASYPIAATKNAKDAAAAAAFVAFVSSSQGETILAKYGFTKP